MMEMTLGKFMQGLWPENSKGLRVCSHKQDCGEPEFHLYQSASKRHGHFEKSGPQSIRRTRALAVELGYMPVVPPKSNRKNPWNYDAQLYKQRNQVEGFFQRIKRFRRIFTRYDKLDVIFLAFVYLALIADALM